MAVPIMLKREEMMNIDLLPLPTILLNLEIIAYKVRTDEFFSHEIGEQLKNYPNEWFCSLTTPKEVMHALAIAVNEAIDEKVDLRRDDIGVLYEQFPELLIKNSRNKQKPLSTSTRFQMKSPLDLAHFVNRGAPQWSLKNLFDHQFDIKWMTPTGEPDDYTFYEFCDTENTSKLFKYKPRQAHVKATLFKECRRKRALEMMKTHLCPTVFIRTVDGWMSWHPASEFDFLPNDLPDEIIDPLISRFIAENADEQKSDPESLQRSLTKPTLYWAVLKDSDFKPGEVLRLKKIGETQVYVGKANNGIKGRWWTDKDNHCEMMLKCLSNVCAMTTYDAMRLDGIQLIDARLALAAVRGELRALFVMKTFDDDLEKAEIRQRKAEMNLDKAKASLNYTLLTTMPHHGQPTGASFDMQGLVQALPFVRTSAPSLEYLKAEEEVAKAEKELEEINSLIVELKDERIIESKDERIIESKADKFEVLLKNAERLHRIGKRDDQPRLNIIPYWMYNMTWRPKDMGYGMNCK